MTRGKKKERSEEKSKLKDREELGREGKEEEREKRERNERRMKEEKIGTRVKENVNWLLVVVVKCVLPQYTTPSFTTTTTTVTTTTTTSTTPPHHHHTFPSPKRQFLPLQHPLIPLPHPPTRPYWSG